MMRIYIAGPMTGLEEFNYPAFNEAAHKLRAKGYDVLNPAEFYPHTDKPREFYIKRSLTKMLLEANAIVMLPGHEKSEGARLELDAAIQCGFTVYRRLEDLL
jgi:hypothetical protein